MTIIREEILGGVRRIIAESTLLISSITDENEVHHFTHGAVHLDRAANAILKYLDSKDVRICKLSKVYGLVEHERLVEEWY